MQMSRWGLALVTLVGCSSRAPSMAADASMSGDGTMNVDDGTPTRQTCTSDFGDALSADATYGRLDGYLVAIVPPANMQSCNDDDSHVHLQIRMNAMIYDIAIDVTDEDTMTDDVHTTTLDVAMPSGGAWAEGWHTGVLADYTSLGLHDTDLTLESKTALVQTLQTDLATANHVSVYATSYGPDGAHLVHRNGSGHDGILVTEPLSTPSHLRLFSFSDQSF
jgi:hypothetical protein